MRSSRTPIISVLHRLVPGVASSAESSVRTLDQLERFPALLQSLDELRAGPNGLPVRADQDIASTQAPGRGLIRTHRPRASHTAAATRMPMYILGSSTGVTRQMPALSVALHPHIQGRRAGNHLSSHVVQGGFTVSRSAHAVRLP